MNKHEQADVEELREVRHVKGGEVPSLVVLILKCQNRYQRHKDIKDGP